jgi:MYXO-CTERM domain-containing protein
MLTSAEVFTYPGTSCATEADCADGFCVDGVCCDSACGGADPTDCQACSVAAGALEDGVGSPLTGSTCDDGNPCTRTDTCRAGACAGGNPDPCTSTDACRDDGTCDPGTGCSNPAKIDGFPCTGGVCLAGGCIPDEIAVQAGSTGATGSSSTAGGNGSGAGAGAPTGSSGASGAGAGNGESSPGADGACACGVVGAPRQGALAGLLGLVFVLRRRKRAAR